MSDSLARGRWADTVFFNVARGVAFITLLLLVGIVLSLSWSAWPAIDKFGFGFLTSTEWNPPAERFGALVPIYGTVVTS
ncbi:MAG TPA: phosphate ABC transporter permease subunit PstC, partial [Pseudomonadales bacterium]|nr:phosphate ABC transporter permease subunit PstC [Pseudomonadales bacterium]